MDPPRRDDPCDAKLAAGLEREPGGLAALRDGGHHGAARADHQLARANDARALALEELAVDGDVARADDLAVREHALGADHELGVLADVDRAVVEQAVDLDTGARIELQRRVAQHVPATEVAPLRVVVDHRNGGGDRADRPSAPRR